MNTDSSWTLAHALDVAATADNLQLCSGTAGSFRVAPTGSLNLAGGTRTININFDNDGLVDIAGGVAGLGGSAPDTNAGHFAIAAGAELAPSTDLPMGATGVIDGAARCGWSAA